LQSAWLVYPSATHCRFGHSLGTMHVAGELARHLFEGIPELLQSLPQGLPSIPLPADLFQTARAYGLLHDLGHGPFGHLFDQVWLKPRFGITHEDISLAIISAELA